MGLRFLLMIALERPGATVSRAAMVCRTGDAGFVLWACKVAGAGCDLAWARGTLTAAAKAQESVPSK